MPMIQAISQIKAVSMSEWVKLAAGVLAAVISAWVLIQQHDYRLSALEKWQEAHIEFTETQSKEIHDLLGSIQRDLFQIMGMIGVQPKEKLVCEPPLCKERG